MPPSSISTVNAPSISTPLAAVVHEAATTKASSGVSSRIGSGETSTESLLINGSSEKKNSIKGYFFIKSQNLDTFD
jgi:hypothetical protein